MVRNGTLLGYHRSCTFLKLNITSPTLSNADGKLTCKFGALINDDRCSNIFEALVGTLRAAKKKKILTFEGQMLLSPAHDDVDIVCL